jgi:uncharacterized protein YbjT (DUF2867 family)
MDTLNRNILVTGATGLTGSEIVRRLSATGVSVRVLVRDISKTNAQSFNILPNVKVFEGDMAKSETLTAALTGTDKAMLISSSNEHMADVQSNFIGCAKKAGVKHIVKLSGIIANIKSPFRFARMHAEIENKLEASGISFTHLRAGEFMQSYFRQVPLILNKDSIILPMEDQKIASIDIADIAEVAVKVLTGSGHEGKVYPITGPEALTMNEVAEKFSAVLGRKIIYINIAPSDAKRNQLAAGVPQYTADALEELFAERRKGRESQVYNTMEEVFGLKPTSFEEFIVRNLPVFKGEHPVPKI